MFYLWASLIRANLLNTFVIEVTHRCLVVERGMEDG